MSLNNSEKTLMETRNCTIESYPLPDLKLKEGQLLHIGSPVPLVEEYFCNYKKAGGLYLYFQPTWVNAKLNLNPWYISFLRKETIFGYVKRLSHLNDEEIIKFLRYIQIDNNISSRYIGGASNKMLINLKIALNKFNFVMLNTAGMSLQGIEKIHDLAASEVRESPTKSVIIFENSSTLRHFNSFEVRLIDLY